MHASKEAAKKETIHHSLQPKRKNETEQEDAFPVLSICCNEYSYWSDNFLSSSRKDLLNPDGPAGEIRHPSYLSDSLQETTISNASMKCTELIYFSLNQLSAAMKLLKIAQYATEVVEMQAWVLLWWVCLLHFPSIATSLPQGNSVSAPCSYCFGSWKLLENLERAILKDDIFSKG